MFLFFLFQTISGKWIFNDDVHIDYQSTAILLIFQLFCIIVTALQKESFIFNKCIWTTYTTKAWVSSCCECEFSDSDVRFSCLPQGGSVVHERFALKLCPQLTGYAMPIPSSFLISRNQDVALSHSWCSKPRRSKSKQTKLVWGGIK